MENSKITLYIISIIIILSCNSKDKQEYIFLKGDLYKRNDTLFVRNIVPNINNEEDSLKYFSPYVMNNDKVTYLSKIINLKTFQKKGQYYIDKNSIYFYNESPLYFPTLNRVPSESKKLIQFHGDYVSTDNKIFFQSKEIKNVDYKTFKVTDKTKDGYYYAYDRDNFYYKDTIIIDNEVLERLNNEKINFNK